MTTIPRREAATWTAAALLAAVLAAGAQPSALAAEVQAPPDITYVEDEPEAPGANPFGGARQGPSRKDAVPGVLELSDGREVPGHICTTRAKRLKIYNLKRERYEHVPVPALRRIEAVVEWEREDPEWRFKEAGNPEKVFTGRKYPVRMTGWRLTLVNDHVIEGHILGQPLYVERDGKAERFILHKRQKGPVGSLLGDVVYVRRVELGPEAYEGAGGAGKKAPQAEQGPPGAAGGGASSPAAGPRSASPGAEPGGG